MSDSVNLLTPVGRIVYESIFEPNTKDMKGKPLTARDGSPRKEYVLKLAVEKTAPGLKEFAAALKEYARNELGEDAPKHPGFSWKFEDGDKPKEGREIKSHSAGCLVFKFSSGYAPQIVKDAGRTSVLREALKAGDYARVYCKVSPNKETNPQGGLGLFLNLIIVEWVAFGDALSSGPDAESILSSSPVHLPEGASKTPSAAGATPDYGILDDPFGL